MVPYRPRLSDRLCRTIRRAQLLMAAAAALGFAASPAAAGGLFVGSNGSQGMQRGGAFVAKADDPSALYYNPAGLIRAPRVEVFAGANLIGRYAQYTRTIDGAAAPSVSDLTFQPVPLVGVTVPRGKYALGFGVALPHAHLWRNFPETVTVDGVETPAPQRYDVVQLTSLAFIPSGAIAYPLTPRLSIGARLGAGVATVDATQYVQSVADDNEGATGDARAQLKGRDLFVVSAGAGVHYRLSRSIEIGIGWNSAVETRGKGNTTVVLGGLGSATSSLLEPVPDSQARCDVGGTPNALKGCLEADIPMTATFGVRWLARSAGGEETGDLEFDVRWENWSAGSDQRFILDAQVGALGVGAPIEDVTIRHGMHDSWSFRLGGSRRYPAAAPRMTLRAGAAYDTATAPVSWQRLLIDSSPRLTLAGGVGIHTKAGSRIDLGAAFVGSPTRTVEDGNDPEAQPSIHTALTPPSPFNPFNAGEYNNYSLILSLGFATSLY
jgi:long-chain fatty acid transport protein